MRNDGAGTRGDQHGDVMGIENLRGFDDQRHIGQILPSPCSSRRSATASNAGSAARSAPIAAIGKEEEPRALAATQGGSLTLSQTAACARDSGFGGKRKIHSLHGASRLRKALQVQRRSKSGPAGNAPFARGTSRDMTCDFAQGIDRRIRHLRETLLEVIPERPREAWREKREERRRPCSSRLLFR